MKRKITYLSFGLFIAHTIIFNSSNVLMAHEGGSPGGKSSSIGDSGNSCGQVGCHGGGHIIDPGGYIITDIPNTGYVPGTIYTVEVKGAGRGKTKFGFELTAENNIGTTLGALAPSLSGKEQLNNGYITHKFVGTGNVGGNFEWKSFWTSPVSGSGNVTFSTAVLFTNANDFATGDSTRVSNFTIGEDLTAGINNIKSDIESVYPNPVINNLNVVLKTNGKTKIIVYNSVGKIVKINIEEGAEFTINFSEIEKGMYFITFEKEGRVYNKTIIKN